MHTATEMFKVSQMSQPEAIQVQSIPYENVHGRETCRTTSKAWYPPRAGLQMTTKSFRHRGYHVWEHLSTELKLKPSLSAFKSAMNKIQ